MYWFLFFVIFILWLKRKVKRKTSINPNFWRSASAMETSIPGDME